MVIKNDNYTLRELCWTPPDRPKETECLNKTVTNAYVGVVVGIMCLTHCYYYSVLRKWQERPIGAEQIVYGSQIYDVYQQTPGYMIQQQPIFQNQGYEAPTQQNY